MQTTGSPPSSPGRNRSIAAVLAVVAAGMVGAAYASVPLYALFCRVTGYGGTTQVATAAPDHVAEREVVVRFDGNVSGLGWTFRPEVPQVHVKLGETKLVNFIAENRGSMESAGTATFNVQPDIAGIYFNKIECFCFTRQELKPGERLEMPVQFFVSPDMAADRELAATHTITLSYTFFPSDPPEAAADAGAAGVARQPVAQADGAGTSDAAGKNL